ncbi:hypothetical protein EDD11_004847 [Mortierella claussenii]|nr:hypothetical protein EDD11_004847 [Mortierella claussenii]
MTTSSSPHAQAKAAVIIRRADPEQDLRHIDELYHIINAAYRSDIGWTNETHLIREERISKDKVNDALHDTNNPLFLAFDAYTNQPLGTLQLSPAEFYPEFGQYQKEGYASNYTETLNKDQQIFLGLVSVDPQQQSRGVGRKLVDAGLKYAKDVLGRKQVAVYVLFQRTELSDWYKRLGFVDHGEKVPYPDPRRLKLDDVHFSVLRLPL